MFSVEWKKVIPWVLAGLTLAFLGPALLYPVNERIDPRVSPVNTYQAVVGSVLLFFAYIGIFIGKVRGSREAIAATFVFFGGLAALYMYVALT